MNNVIIEFEKLENFLMYLEDKTQDVYEDEVKQAIDRFLKEQIIVVRTDF